MVADTSSLLKILPVIRGTYRENALLSKTNWFNVGGPAQVLFRPADCEDLCFFLRKKPADIPVTILGVGSNVLIRDGGINGVVVKLGRHFAAIEKQGLLIHAGAAALGFNTAMFAARAGFAGIEFLSGIPGTIGGALAMNAGAYGREIADVLEYAEAVDESGQLHRLDAKNIGYIYRGHTLPENFIFTKAVFLTQAGNTDDILAAIHHIAAKRLADQPIKSRTSGSTFKNPPHQKAWELIDQAGCRGLRVGGAEVSDKHCNFLINTGNASASDIENLGLLVQERVAKHCGVILEWEIKIIGEKAC